MSRQARAREAPPSADRDHSGRGAGWSQIVATSLGFAVVQLDVSVVNVALRPIGAALGGDVSALQWVVNAYTVVFAALILTAGALGDRVGARRVFLAGFGVFTAASLACGLAPSLGVLVAARAVQGAGAAALVSCSLALLSHAFPDPTERGRAVSLWAAGASVALTGGPLVGGVLTQAFGWRAIFFINLPIGAAAVWLTVARVAETPSDAKRGVDLAGQVAAIVALTALAGAMIEGGQRGFGDPFVLAAFLVAILAGAAFLRVERAGRTPMLPLSLFSSRTFSGASAIGLAVNVAFYGLIFVFSLYFQTVQGLSALQTGLAFAPTTLAVMGGNLVAPRCAIRWGPARVLAAGGALMAIGVLALLVIDRGTPYGVIVAPLVLVGLGVGLIVPVMTASLLGSVDPALSGVASGALNTARQTGSVIGVSLYGALFASARITGIHVGLAISAALALLTVLLARAVGTSE
jgi:DHA2 family methylenomycin A resistance protein-like MFS transporter